ncbi:hypothetical protein [Streptomyces pacificus]|uniref:Uncharacterized protein n=1 Tax=Streptomyces pacificus TaxID=2705029 RepID=A0A6A0AW90_9ACTN|nr:hypothetical protein [Streptomyces pacificus]GFH36633.1 hypothetical protein SCWH03_28640 [Streptomyces pacificus]
MPDVGDLVTASLTVAPYDETTSAALLVTRPDGTTVSPTVTGSGGGQTWAAPVSYTLAGVWRLSWTVTGTGASVEHQLVSVAPAPGGGGAAGRTYATTTQLANYLGTAPPLDSARLLRQASVLLDTDFLLTAIYDVDTAGIPTDSEVAQAFADAVCAQVEFWGEVGEETDISGPLEGVSIGSVQLQFGAGDNRTGPDYYAPKLTRALASLPSDKIRFGVALGAC